MTINAEGAARLFLLARGRGGDNASEDHAALSALLREFALAGFAAGLERAKVEIRQSADAGRCKMLSEGEQCKCALCCIDNARAG